MKTHEQIFGLGELRHWSGTAPIQLAVLGDPVAHSASPPMHNAALLACGLPQRYGRLHIRPAELSAAVPLLGRSGFLGVNLTIPHKVAVLPMLDVLDGGAQVLGAVNTIAIRDQKLHGFNTDGPGLVRAIAADFGVRLGELRVLILGAGGGAGRAIALQCALEGCPRITLVNRTLQKVEALAGEVSKVRPAGRSETEVHALGSEDSALAEHVAATDLILQCSSVGMHVDDPSPLCADFLRRSHLVYDTIYSNRSQLISAAAALGARTANGLSLLLHQGALAFEIWFQRPAPVEVMHAALLEARAKANS